ncbi:hypothetical protein [Shinella pollutisoli]|uniref:Uncharacterized protein n=1 Tax=Shinella pollutisoli TaxID=2250594 RepID=A0ABV7DBQ7_9HYPH|nr:hypothetical protein [Shinella pollutisoli]
MRSILVAVLMLAGTFHANAACNESLLEITAWNIQAIDADTNELSYSIRSNAAKDIRMIDGQLGFRDALGGRIGPLQIERDTVIPAGGTFTDKGLWGRYTFERLLRLKKEEVEPYTCIRAVLYEDGTKETFD